MISHPNDKNIVTFSVEGKESGRRRRKANRKEGKSLDTHSSADTVFFEDFPREEMKALIYTGKTNTLDCLPKKNTFPCIRRSRASRKSETTTYLLWNCAFKM
jgi:hypothetical protein